MSDYIPVYRQTGFLVISGGEMRKRQKIILIMYMYAVIFFGFIYVPYLKHFPNGVSKFVGHHLRVRFFALTTWEKTVWGPVTIDANLIIAELLAITAVTIVIFLLFKSE